VVLNIFDHLLRKSARGIENSNDMFPDLNPRRRGPGANSGCS
jgi:hypothetical protein